MDKVNIITIIISVLSLIISGLTTFYTYKQAQSIESQLKNDFIQKLIDNLKKLKILLLEIEPEPNFSGLTQKHHLDLEKIRNFLLYQQSIIRKHLAPSQEEMLNDLQLDAEDTYGFIISNHPDNNLKKEQLINKINILINIL